MVEAFLLSHTQVFKGWNERLDSLAHLSAIDKLCEFAARTCYASNEKFLTDPNFITNIIHRGHIDVFEHAWMSFAFDGPLPQQHEMLESIFMNNRYVSAYWSETFFGERKNNLQIAAPLRIWKDLLSKDVRWLPKEDIEYELSRIAPASMEAQPEEKDGIVRRETLIDVPFPLVFNADFGAKVTLLSRMQSFDVNSPALSSSTFLFENVSRTFTHQLIRHRLGAYSQESQRYVSVEKAGTSFVTPPAIASNPKARYIYEDIFVKTLLAYEKLIAIEGIKKEDARFALLGGATTKIVVTMPDDGWKHFMRLRALDKAAQWEIRGVGLGVLKLLERAAYPNFKEEIDMAYSSGLWDRANDPHRAQNRIVIETSRPRLRRKGDR